MSFDTTKELIHNCIPNRIVEFWIIKFYAFFNPIFIKSVIRIRSRSNEGKRIVFRVKVFFRAEDFFDFPGNFEIREEKICWFFLSFDQRMRRIGDRFRERSEKNSCVWADISKPRTRNSKWQSFPLFRT